MARENRRSGQSFNSLMSSPALAGPGMGSTGNPAAGAHDASPPMNTATPPNGHVMAKCPKCGAALKISGASRTPRPSTPMKGGGANDNDADDMY